MKFGKANKKELKKVLVVCCLTLVMVFAFSSLVIGKTSETLPWENTLEVIMNSIKGPVAVGVSICAIAACGIALVFGGDMQGFIRQALYLALVIALIICAANVLMKMNSKNDGNSTFSAEIIASAPSVVSVIRG